MMGGFAWVGLAHLAATNILSSVRLLLWEPNFGHLNLMMMNGSSTDYLLANCFNNKTGQLLGDVNQQWLTSLKSYLMPFMVDYRSDIVTSGQLFFVLHG